MARRRAQSLPPAAALALLLGAVVVYAAGSSGAILLPPAARVEVAVAGLAVAAVAALLFVPGVRASTTAAGWAGLGLLLAFAVWTGVSLAWSIEPDGTWVQLNRAIAYALTAVVGLIVGASLPSAARRVALGYLAIATAVALYALGGKALPELHVAGVFDLNHTAFFSRLRAPLAYWNALALFCVLAVPIALHAAVEPLRSRWQQPLAVGALVVLLTTIGLTYSRGGVAAATVALVVVLLLGPDRLELAATALAGLAGAAAPLALGFTLHALTTDEVPLHDRTGDGALFGVALLAGIAVAVVATRVILPRARRAAPVRIPRRAAFAVGTLLVVAAFAVAVAGGSVSQGFESFKSVKFERQSDPARILQTNSGNRWVWWNEALGAWSDRPLHGWGAGSFPLLHLRYRQNQLEVLQPHSVPLEWLAELGLVGALLGLGGLGALAVAGGRRVVAAGRGLDPGVLAGPDQRYGAALAAAAAAWLVHMWFDWDWDIPGVTLPLMVFLGVLAARPRGRPGHTLRAERPAVAGRSVALGLAAVLACAVAVSAALPSLSRDHLESARAAVAANDLPKARDETDIATRLDPLGVDALLLSARVAGRQAQFGDASAALRKAVQREPDDPDVWLGVARFDLARGDIPALLQASRTMLRLDPVGSFGRFFFYAADFGVRSATATGTPLTP